MLNLSLATPSEIGRELGARIRRQRLAGGLRQRDLAARAGVSANILRNLEREGHATLDSFIRVVLALGMADQFVPLVDTRTTSLKAMEQASRTRQRAPRKPV